MRQLFLSHATRDVDLVKEVKARLTAIGVDVYLAEYDGRAGEDVHDKIANAIDRSHLVVVLLTGSGYESKYVHQEIGWARSRNKLIVPVVTTAAAQGGLGMLEGLEYIVIDELAPEEAFEKLDQRIRDLVQKWRTNDAIEIAVLVAAVGALILVLND